MDSLPLTLLEQISSYLSPADQRSLRLTNRLFSTVAARFLFSVLSFSGAEQVPRYGHLGRDQTVEYGGVHLAVSEVLPLARYVKTFRFAPAFYHYGMWQTYERYRNRRRGNPAVATAGLDEESWQRKMAAQKDNKDAVISSLATLFREMELLKRVEIAGPSFSGKIFGDMDFDHDIGFETSKVDSFLRDVSQSLQLARRHIKILDVCGLLAERLDVSEPLRHVFTGLESVSLDIREVDFLLEDAPVSKLKDLFECARLTLRNFDITGGKHRHLPARGVHSLSKILFHEDDTTPKVFPNLRSFGLKTLIISTQPFIDFIVAQPKVSSFRVHFVYLGTPNLGWLDVAAVLPATIEEWTSGTLGHEPVPGFQPPLAYNWVSPWRPWEDSLLSRTGWQGTTNGINHDIVFRRV